MDVEQLKQIKSGQNSPGQICKVCQIPKPFTEFYESSAGSGKYVKECKACTKSKVKEQDRLKKEKLKYIGEPQEQPVSDEKGNVMSWEESPPSEPLRTCRKCGFQGTDDEFHKIGQVPTTVCRACSRKKRSESIAKTTAEKAGPRDREGCVWINFKEFPDILEAIRTDAKRNFRTMQNEILFRLVNGHV